MSRTDKHAPWHVQVMDPAIRARCYQSHNHFVDSEPYTEYPDPPRWIAGMRIGIRRHAVRSSVPCDLWTELGRGRCRFYPTWNTCGCSMCTGRHEARERRRRDRHRARQVCRDTLKQVSHRVDPPM